MSNLQATMVVQFLDMYSKIIDGEIDLNNDVIKSKMKWYFNRKKEKCNDMFRYNDGINLTNLILSSHILDMMEEDEKEVEKNNDNTSQLLKDRKLILTKSEAAKIAGTTRQTLDAWVDNPKHPLPECFPNDDGIKKGNPYIYYPDLVEYIEKRRELKAAKLNKKKSKKGV